MALRSTSFPERPLSGSWDYHATFLVCIDVMDVYVICRWTAGVGSSGYVGALYSRTAGEAVLLDRGPFGLTREPPADVSQDSSLMEVRQQWFVRKPDPSRCFFENPE
jgi:hypothetical protein